ncbi:MAG: tRNA preQ1(34) S-adenosylmethionine ribosyltransferase-isomerase QueA [Desulfitobacteriaceae bacterium]|nr:tRNA preQ1(34) S-adenosylmethionine ribosyltransferase-isomerase QueA [Desulfitobacteriaceae bacterium]MDD4346998.1 tRNA preQ1(34) S-adenosylmethionine ribosyltransferase-isomerase QueA [Desulfitobacteriaceae bacterium]MDD4402084.1 tRNA preQ1(34) S-adenosylmethionine ribosyltransferase-isomerase QueA [Desulfitobacteriaceae bacterium]
MNVSDFDFYLPGELIAQRPIEPRDSSRLMVVNRTKQSIENSFFGDLGSFLRAGDVLVLNNTKVLPARLIGYKQDTQARIEVLLLKRQERDIWEVLVRPGKRLKVGQCVFFAGDLLKGQLMKVLASGNRLLGFEYKGVFEEVLDRLGKMPLPPYITTQLENQERYQTVYAKERGSAAAPTAGLHFTAQLLEQLKAKGVEVAEILLHVGLGTFRPVKAEDIRAHVMHSEYYRVLPETAERLNLAKKEGRRVIAVGTTSARTLESIADEAGFVKAGEGWTDIFIYPGYQFQVTDGLVTNFHFPRSTLVMLVSAFAGYELTRKAYLQAVKECYRFYSFGDAMLII